MNQLISLAFRFSFLIVIFLAPVLSSAQVEMADDFRGEGKIYIVIAIILTILSGFFFLLFKLDSKSKRLEKEINEK